MAISFHDEYNKYTYTGRLADSGWMELIRKKARPQGKTAADIGCGGGIYSVALAELGASSVVGIDFSEAMLQGAAEHCTEYGQIRLAQGTADRTGLPDDSVVLVLERALIHHVPAEALPDVFREAQRILKPGGLLIVQDRTPEDCLLPGSREHLRGYWFEKYPRLRQLEAGRRHDAAAIRKALEASGFSVVEETLLWEVRKSYASYSDYREELLSRKGRSILHELSDAELQDLADAVAADSGFESKEPVEERDRWTIFFAQAR
ncbi:methyltransferase type 11 [Paenibacillus elgii]|uniref:Methyltransferase type 11 n=1 Tax=Paenibacillus elgii TaxID=189691 RepID=A0A163WHW0_9BACL|nr:class I SAM-dependent methyltransferase [Paenibacillus elgii]KZE76383.1 methyltransferase type 11 [Paenibacillus elgii]